MAMMMTGRVLLVCALCVLWCGAGGGDAEMNDESLVDSQHVSGVGEKAPKGLPESGERVPDSAGHSLGINNGINSNLQEGTGTGTTTDRVVKNEEEEVETDFEEEEERSKEGEDTEKTGKSESSSKEMAATIPTASVLSESGGGIPSGVDGVGSSESSDGSEDLNLEVSGPVVKSPPSIPNGTAGGLQNADGALSSQKNNFLETGVHSGTTPVAPSLPKSQAPAMPKPKAEEQSPTEQDTEEAHSQPGEVNATALNSSLGNLSQGNNSDAGTMRGSGLLPLLILLLLGLWGFAAL
ncbi:mucin-associated surface protein (MASP), putative [Trypanosoma cruzi]|uniref:Mucin-associated surface protein (MASP), putative n=1 Tax=Trypanosoma cruzi (strain CL Brener) TaxID=353153 RepID=Q4E1G1_TRYCC|nr:mucin-associated surface protein (MASP), putative [Trypanosoma cruzi]EAN98615.1 mucin-associated surface protein (MASP), putative [Trypanosoma cruzi]|eukprot:XP_820466.1 mucin-associated surface protein (MASP) [Trypanosoma cruzi strain CL Brener]